MIKIDKSVYFVFVFTLLIASFALTACGDNTQSIDEPSITTRNVRPRELPAIIHFDYLRFDTTDELLSEALDFSAHIVRVEILDERLEVINTWLPPTSREDDSGEGFQELYETFTVNRLKILEVFQSRYQPGDIIEVWQMGGDPMRVNMNKTTLSVGDDLIMFLTDNRNDENRPKSLLNPSQSAYRSHNFADGVLQTVETGGLRGDEVLESVNETNSLILTISDLFRIAEELNN